MKYKLLSSAAIGLVMVYYFFHRKQHHLLDEPFDWIGAGGAGFIPEHQ